MKGDASIRILSNDDDIHFIHEKTSWSWYKWPQCLQPENQIMKNEEESDENLTPNCVKQQEKMKN